MPGIYKYFTTGAVITQVCPMALDCCSNVKNVLDGIFNVFSPYGNIDVPGNAKKDKTSQFGCSTNLSAAPQIDDKAKLTMAISAFIQMKNCNNYLSDNIPILSTVFEHCGFELLLGYALSTSDKCTAAKEGNIDKKN